ncbi:MAG: protoheme IX farnesyltransferase [Alphaproteobacteria bacterium]|nr:protoheme IX farnesyltransferase [Alphaproteobacteria bacterium]
MNAKTPSRADTLTAPAEPRFRVTNYALLLKPRVMSLVVFTAAVGMFLAPGSFTAIDPAVAIIAVLCIAVGAGASGAINMWYDRDIDLHMLRTRNRPLPAGRLVPEEALAFGVFLSIGSVAAMAQWVNALSSILLAATILYYVFIYTVWLKRRTPHNIVIGGASGALPPVIGWAAVTGDVGFDAFLLFAIIFLWTPPHTWALALFRRGDYEAAGVPMLPVVAGERETKRQMLIYTAILIPVTLLPVVTGMAGAVYAIATIALSVGLARHAWRVWTDDSGADGGKTARPMFFFTILYLFLIFAALLADKVLFLPVL